MSVEGSQSSWMFVTEPDIVRFAGGVGGVLSMQMLNALERVIDRIVISRNR